MSAPPPDVPVHMPGWLEQVAGPSVTERAKLKRSLIRVLILANVLLGTRYITWRAAASLNWDYWPLAIALLLAEFYSFTDCILWCAMMWRYRVRADPPPAPPDHTVDVFITTYNEDVDRVRTTARAAKAIRYPHTTWVLDDGDRPAMRAMAEAEGVHYLTRSAEWQYFQRHAKAGNVINALNHSAGSFLLILDADQVPHPAILHRTLGWFDDPSVAFVQTPQWFSNIPEGDPFGNDAPLFYGPIQQAKDGWNAAFFCGSNAVLRREALQFSGLVAYARDREKRIRRALRRAPRVIERARAATPPEERARMWPMLARLRAAALWAQHRMKDGEVLQDITWDFQREVNAITDELLGYDALRMEQELAALGLSATDAARAAEALRVRDLSPLATLGTLKELLQDVDLDRAGEAAAVMPLETSSITEDMATAMRLHGLGFKSIYHHQVLAVGLAPEDLRTMLQQRLRWAQGTLQVMLRNNPLWYPGLQLGQRLMYVATMWSYLSGFASLVYIAAPILYLLFGWQPVSAWSGDFFEHLLPWLLINQVMFIFVSWRLSTWRGQQYSLSLFPLWIQAVTSTIGNVWFNKPLSFVVTPKTRQEGMHLHLVRWQLLAIALLCLSIGVGLTRLAFAEVIDPTPIWINIAWASYDVLMLSAVIDALLWRPEPEASPVLEPA